MAITELTPIQQQAVPELLAGRDLTGQAQTGSGKTAAFAIPIIESVDLGSNQLQSLILVPTRELSMQISEEILRLGRYLPDLSVMPVYGGTPLYRQIKRIKRGGQVIVGTPGRVLDLIERKVLRPGKVRTFVLDEADEMFSMGFRDDIARVMSYLNAPQKVFFSATLPQSIRKFAEEYQNEPVRIEIAETAEDRPQIQQSYYKVHQRAKMHLLENLLRTEAPRKAVIFCNTQRMVDMAANSVKAWGYSAEGLHGGLSQGARTQIMQKFRGGQYDILIATDVAARGIDVSAIDLIINYDIPADVAYYVHRIGRTARAGQKGRAISIVPPMDLAKIAAIERFTGTEIQPMETPAEWGLDQVMAPKAKTQNKTHNSGRKAKAHGQHRADKFSGHRKHKSGGRRKRAVGMPI